jgi:effector-binding domain-containing protein
MDEHGPVITEVIVEPRLVAGVRAVVARGGVGAAFRQHLDQVYAAARAGAVSLDGQNIFIYRDATEHELIVDFCVGVTAPFTATGNVMPLETPAGRAAMLTHHGDYSGLAAATASLRAWCLDHNRPIAGASWEVYGHWDPDPSKLRTDVYYLLKPKA